MGLNSTKNDEHFVELVHNQLRRLVSGMVASSVHQMQCGKLIQESYLRFATDMGLSASSRNLYFMAAAEVFRSLATAKAANPGIAQIAADETLTRLIRGRLSTLGVTSDQASFNWALDRISERNERAADVVKLRCFAGLNREEVAQLLNISVKAADACWKHAQWFMQQEVEAVGTQEG